MTVDELIESIRGQGWRVRPDGLIRDELGRCPLRAAFGIGWVSKSDQAGLPTGAITSAADYRERTELRAKLLTLVEK